MTSRITSTFFSALPGSLFFIWFLSSGLNPQDYFWNTYLIVITILLGSSLLFGFALPHIFQRLRIGHPWIWILIQGLLAWILAVCVLGLLNMTPLCVGQDNGDGNNDFGMCMFMTALSGIVYTPIYLMLLGASALAGQWVMKYQNGTVHAE